jgi:hypothetical protein
VTDLPDDGETFVRQASFLEFVEAMGVTLDPGQREAARVLFDGEAPDPSMGLFGFEGPPPDEARAVAELVAGVRSGKSRIFGALRALHLALSADVSGLGPGERIVCAFVAPREHQARITWRYAQGAALEHPDVRPFVLQSSGERFVLASPLSGTPISFECRAASSAGVTLRGEWMLYGYLEEAGFFGGHGAAVSGSAIYDAFRQRIWPRGGQLALGSSPWSQEGKLYELWAENFVSPRSAVVCQAPTDKLRSGDPYTLRLMADARREYEHRGELDLWWREWGARFLALGSSRLYDEDTLSMCGEARRGDVQPGDLVVAGADLGIVSDHAGLAINRIRPGAPRNRSAIVDLDEVSPEPGKPLVPSVLCRRFAGIMARHGVKWCMADGHYREALREALEGTGIVLINAPKDPAEPHVRARTLMRDGVVDLLPDVRARHQLSLVKRRHVAGGRTAVELPRGGTHGHCDVAQAIALALYQAHGAIVEGPAPPPGSPAFFAAQQAADEAAEEADLPDDDEW